MASKNVSLVRNFSRSRRVGILDLIKRREAMSVREIAAGLGLSYMGAKQHCSALEKAGYLATWRRPREGTVGRPEVAYRLTPKADDLFPSASNPLTVGLLKSAAALYGPLAPEKILYHYYEGIMETLRRRVRGQDAFARARWLARLRDADGYMAEVEGESPLRVVERHCPLADVIEHYPCIARFDEELYTKIVGVRMTRRTGGRLPDGVVVFEEV